MLMLRDLKISHQDASNGHFSKNVAFIFRDISAINNALTLRNKKCTKFFSMTLFETAMFSLFMLSELFIVYYDTICR
jgi:hypothetical protein